MLTCPMCKKKLRGMEKECLNCRTDVSLLVHYVEDLREGLARAEALTRAGQLGEAVWAYLSVLEVDPDNSAARRQVGQVATAVRQFDRTAPSRRWPNKWRFVFRRWSTNWEGEGGGLLWFLLIIAVLTIGFVFGYVQGLKNAPPPDNSEPDTKIEKPEKSKKTEEAGKPSANK